VPPEAVDTARDTLGGAVAVSAELPPQIGSALVEAARVSFVDGIHIVAAVTTVVAVAAAIAAARLLWNVPKRADRSEVAVTTQAAASA
jgi:DHA2 family multidrug resistance protein-like MFS transporter